MFTICISRRNQNINQFSPSFQELLLYSSVVFVKHIIRIIIYQQNLEQEQSK